GGHDQRRGPGHRRGARDEHDQRGPLGDHGLDGPHRHGGDPAVDRRDAGQPQPRGRPDAAVHRHGHLLQQHDAEPHRPDPPRPPLRPPAPAVPPAAATTSAAGLAPAGAPGTSTISAALSGITGSTVLTVTAAPLQSIAVTPANPTLAAGLTQQFTATGTFSNN